MVKIKKLKYYNSIYVLYQLVPNIQFIFICIVGHHCLIVFILEILVIRMLKKVLYNVLQSAQVNYICTSYIFVISFMGIANGI